MKTITAIISIGFVYGCVNQKSACMFTSAELIKDSGARIFGTKKSNERIVEFRDKGKDSIAGGYYTFYNNGNLKSYQFFVDIKTYIYVEEYNASGALTKVEGDPHVRNAVELIKDSLLIRLYFFALNKNYKKVNILTSDNRNLNLTLLDDTLYSNMKTASFNYTHLKEEKDIASYINVDYEDECTHNSEHIKDSLVLHYKPN
jgi:hypothetical protein